MFKFKHSNLNITVFDDVFTSEQLAYMFQVARKAGYFLTNNDVSSDPGKEQKLVAGLDIRSLEYLKFFQFLDCNEINTLIDNRIIENAYINLGIPVDPHRIHVDSEAQGYLTLLFYLNDTWNINWGGETIFLNNQNEIEFTSEFKPGRIIVFDSSIPHAARPQTIDAISYRFSLAIKFSKKNEAR
jgi:2OG-Fe(II) oxygenase superfamily